MNRSAKNKSKTPMLLFTLGFAVIMGLTFWQHMTKDRRLFLSVPDNKGVAELATVADRLICVFQDGQVCIWDWNDLTAPYTRAAAASERAVLLSETAAAAVTTSGRKLLARHDVTADRKLGEFTVGLEDQQVWPRLSPDRTQLALVRQNPPHAARSVLYEFMTADLKREITGLPVGLEIAAADTLVDFVLGSDDMLYAAGSRDGRGRLLGVNLRTGQIAWDHTLSDVPELCTLALAERFGILYAGSRDSRLFRIAAADGAVQQQMGLLGEGERRDIFNNFSVLNAVISPKQNYLACVIHPAVYIIDLESGRLIHQLRGAHKLTNKLAFSPDETKIATSDIRASGVIRIHALEQ